MAPDDPTSPVERARGFVARARQAPATVDSLARGADEARAGLEGLRAAVSHLEQLIWAARDDTRGGVAAIGDELHRLHRQIGAAEERLETLDAALAGQAAALHRAVAAPARHAAARALRDTLGPAPALRPGLSVFTLVWNHGGLLAESAASGLAVLDQLAPADQGELLILDDGSTDSTPEVAAHLAASDPRVRVVRSPLNLGLALARSALLHTATTEHAFQLDADNTAVPEGVVELHRAARATGAAVTYGTVVQLDGEGRALGPISNEPPTPALFRSNYIDTMAVVDVAAFRALGGWSADPLLEHVDDWAAIWRVAEAGQLIAFVPVLVGRYRVLETAFHRTVTDPRLGAGRVARVLDPTGRRQGDDPLEGVAAVAWDPAAGPLWATPEARAIRPDLAPPAAAAPPIATVAERDRVLVIAPGGVANLGDDAITERGLERVRAAVGPDVALDLVTDGAHLTSGVRGVRWLGPLIDALPGLGYDDLGRLDEHLAAAAETALVGEGRWRPLAPETYRAAVFLGGGSLAEDFAPGLIAPRALLGAALRTRRVPWLLSGQGVGPLRDGGPRALTARLLAGAVAVSCRDATSAEVARSLPGVDPTRVSVTGDDALGLRPRGTPPAGARPSLVVTVRRAAYVGTDDPARAWALRADAVAAARGWDVTGVALNHQDPEPELATLATLRATLPLAARWRLVDCGGDPGRLAAECAGAAAVATQSFHAALFGLAAGRPTVLGADSPYYELKALGLGERAGLEDLGVTPDDDLGAALDAVGAALAIAPSPLARATAAVDAWWATVSDRLGVGRGDLSAPAISG